MRIHLAAGLCWIAALTLAAAPVVEKGKGKKPPLTPKAGIKTPGVQIPIESVTAEAQVSVETPGWITIGSAVFAPSKSKDLVVRLDPKTNKALDPVTGVGKPCSGSVVAFGSLWVPSCATGAVARVDTKTYKVAETLATGAEDVLMGIAATADSIWMLTDAKTTLSRIDPVENKVVGELRLPADCNSIAFGEESLWVTCPSQNRLLRINPATNLVDKRIEVSANPRSVAFGAGSVWVLCDKEGKIERIDPKTNKVIKTLALNVPNGGGNIAFGEGWLWVTQTGFPVTRIDTKSEKEVVAQQFFGEGGGLIAAGSGGVWLANVSQGTVSRFDPKRIVATLPE